MDKTVTKNTGDLTWGHLEETEIFGRKTCEEDYIQVNYDDLRNNYALKSEASHCLIYAKTDYKIFDIYQARAIVLMQMRFDGYVGFPGGLVDVGEDVVNSLNRELDEEMNMNSNKYKVTRDNHIVSHYNIKTGLGLHFYTLQLSMKDLIEVEKCGLYAKHFGSEALGTIRVPLYTMGDGYRGFPVFLKNQFIGNSKQQLLYTLKKLNIMNENEIQRALKATQ